MLVAAACQSRVKGLIWFHWPQAGSAGEEASARRACTTSEAAPAEPQPESVRMAWSVPLNVLGINVGAGRVVAPSQRKSETRTQLLPEGEGQPSLTSWPMRQAKAEKLVWASREKSIDAERSRLAAQGVVTSRACKRVWKKGALPELSKRAQVALRRRGPESPHALWAPAAVKASSARNVFRSCPSAEKWRFKSGAPVKSNFLENFPGRQPGRGSGTALV